MLFVKMTSFVICISNLAFNNKNYAVRPCEINVCKQVVSGRGQVSILAIDVFNRVFTGFSLRNDSSRYGTLSADKAIRGKNWFLIEIRIW